MSSKTQGLIDSESVERLLVYQADGVYGENAKKETDPQLEDKAA